MGIMNRRRLGEWARALGRPAAFVKAWKMLFLIFSRNSSRELWWERMRICNECPLYDRKKKSCGINEAGMGCGCYMPFKAAKTKSTCWARDMDFKFGWKIR